MGLDAVELVMDVEDHFGITIADGEAEHLRTVGDLGALIHGRVVAAAPPQCLALPVFLSLRALIRDVVADQAVRMKPSHAIIDHLSAMERRQLWLRLPELLSTTPRPLRRPKPVRIVLASISAALMVCAVALGAIDWAILPLTFLIAVGLVIVLYLMTSRLCIVPPDGFATLGDITLKIVGLSAAVRNRDLPDDRSILDEIVPIVADNLGVDRDEVVLNARFVEDLGMG